MNSNNPEPQSATDVPPHPRRERSVRAWWRLVFGSRSGQAHGYLRFWPFWEWVTLHVMPPHYPIPNAPYHVFEVQFTRYDAKPITLPDGTQVRRGDRIAIVHINNRVVARLARNTTPWQHLRMM